jgi:hypothetical protein
MILSLFFMINVDIRGRFGKIYMFEVVTILLSISRSFPQLLYNLLIFIYLLTQFLVLLETSRILQ